MSQFGGGGMPAQAPQGGQVTFFDPSNFQKGATDFPASSNSASQQQNPPQFSGAQNFASDAAPNQSAWSSWNGGSNPYIDTSTGQGGYVNTSTSNNFVNSGHEVNAYGGTTGQQEGNFPTSVANDVQYNQQWYDQSQWNQDPQQQGQYQWDGNSQQWAMGQYDYSQVSDPNQYTGYNQTQYWAGGEHGAGVNGNAPPNMYNQDFQQTDASGQIVQSTNNYFVGDPRSHIAQTDCNSAETGQDSGASTSATESSTRQEETSDELDVSQSTTESESQSHSLGQLEESSLDGYFQNEEFVHESETKVDQQSEQMLPPGEQNARNIGAGEGSHVIEQHTGVAGSEAGLVGQMQAVSLQDNTMSQDVHGNIHTGFQPTQGQSNTMENHGAPQYFIPQPPQEVPMFTTHPAAGSTVQDTHTAVAPPIDPPHIKGSGENQEHQTPTFSDWEMVPQQEAQASHSRNASIDNNVHFFISSNNSSARVSPSSSSKTGADDKENKPELGDKSSNVKSQENPEPSKDNLGPPPVNLRPPSQGSNKGDNPFRKSPNTSMLSSTQLEVTKGNNESPVILNRSISPIPATEEVQSERQRQATRDTDSPDIHIAQSAQPLADKPVSSHTNKQVPQSPILPRKESPFQPPAKLSENKGKPLRASHDMQGVNIYTQRKSSDENPHVTQDRRERRTPDREVERNSGRKTPDRRREGRRTPDWDSSERRREGRRTPDWDNSDKRREGRRTPDWDSSDRRREGRRTPDWDRHDRRDRDRLAGRPPVAPSDSQNRSHRTRQSAFHQYQVNRNKNNVSPATSLWDTPDVLPTVSNILLMPAAGSTSGKSDSKDTSAPAVLTPVASLITSLSEQIKTDDPNDKKTNHQQSRGKDDTGNKSERSKDSRYDREKDSTLDSSVRSGYPRDKEGDSRDRIRGNRSYESLRDRDRGSKNDSRYGSRDSLEQDDPKDRSRRGDSRERERGNYRDKDSYYDRYRDRDRDRPASRTSTVDGYGRRDFRDRDRDRDYYRRDRPDRPRSRQTDRPPSRQGDSDRPKSRNDYDKDQYYKDKYRNTEYDYDDYYRRKQYYDRQYYDYYYGNYNQGGYYDEYGYYHQDNGQARFDYPPDLHDYSRGGYDEYSSYYGYEQNGYRWDPDINNWVATTAEVIPQRQTPEKFVIPHVQACFGPNGQLVRVVPNRPADGEPAIVEIIDVQQLLTETEESEELQEFPGPLVKGDTHKNDILLFCQRKAKDCSENMNLEDRESTELIWKFLELLIKQNGTVVGTDIADLLLQGHEPTTLDYKRTGMKIAASTASLDDDDGSEGSRVSRGTTPIDKSMINKTKPLEEVTDRFRHLLLFGRKKDALDWAMKNNLWGHALFLASKMDSRAHANVMTRFANVAMRMNDPLQTLYQLMSGRQPAAVTSVTEERWGDWRPHLAMILSNHTHKPDLDRKCITTLGDTLASKGLLHASHFCYLMSQTSFGSYMKKSSKIVLVGSSHGLPLEYFANNNAIQCTEIYEYALALGNTCICLANFQYFKYLYCTRLVDCGYAQEALQYCEVISRNINTNPAFYSHILVKLVYDLSCQLKFADPQYVEESDDSPDPDWLRGLHTTLVQFEEGAIQPMSGSATPAYFGGGTTASSESGEVGMYMQGPDGTTYIQDQSYVQNTGQMYSIQEHSQYQHNVTGQTEYQHQQFSQQQMFESGHMTGQQAQHQYGDHVTTAENHNTQQGGNSHEHTGDGYIQSHTEGQYAQPQWPDPSAETTNQGQEYQSTNQQQADSANQFAGSHSQPGDQVQHYQPNQHIGANQNAGHWSHVHQPTGFPPNVNLGESQNSGMSGDSVKRSSLASTSSFSQDGGTEDAEDQPDGGYQHQPSIFDLQPTQQKIVAPRLRQRTISESSAGSTTNSHNHNKKSTQRDEMEGLDSKSKQNQKQGGGIWNKIGGLFSRKNEMKLPDDKEPSIVWDSVNNKWVDKDADEVDSGPAPPPPKDAELTGPSHMPTVPEGPSPALGNSGAPPPMGGNKFSRRKGIGARSQYVDVMNPKPTSTSQVPSSLFHTLPSSRSAPAIFNPGGGSDTSEAAPQQQQKQETIPEEKSGAMNSNNTGMQLPPPSDNKSDQAGPTGTPALFNPAQFQPNQGFKQPAAPAPGHRLSSRRVYPK